MSTRIGATRSVKRSTSQNSRKSGTMRVGTSRIWQRFTGRICSLLRTSMLPYRQQRRGTPHLSNLLNLARTVRQKQVDGDGDEAASRPDLWMESAFRKDLFLIVALAWKAHNAPMVLAIPS